MEQLNRPGRGRARPRVSTNRPPPQIARAHGAIEAGQYAADTTGFSTAVYDRWFSQKHGKLCSQNAWVKLDVMVGAVTHAVTSALVTSEGDCPQLPGLFARTRVHHDVREVSADKAYASVDTFAMIKAKSEGPGRAV